MRKKRATEEIISEALLKVNKFTVISSEEVYSLTTDAINEYIETFSRLKLGEGMIVSLKDIETDFKTKDLGKIRNTLNYRIKSEFGTKKIKDEYLIYRK